MNTLDNECGRVINVDMSAFAIVIHSIREIMLIQKRWHFMIVIITIQPCNQNISLHYTNDSKDMNLPYCWLLLEHTIDLCLLSLSQKAIQTSEHKRPARILDTTAIMSYHA